MKYRTEFKAQAIYQEGYNGVLVQYLDDYNYDAYVRFKTVYGSHESKVSRPVKIRETAAGRPYFLCHGRRIHLDECMRLCY